MQYFNKLLLCLVLSAFCGRQAFSQNLILAENFDTYTGADSSAPAGWYISKHDFYATGTSSGINPNAFKFSADSVILITPYFSGADSVNFWIKGFSTTGSSLYIYESADSLNWDSLAVVDPLPTQTAQGSKHFAVKNTSHYLLFLYRKVAGNLSFDDFELWGSSTLSIDHTSIPNEFIVHTLSNHSYSIALVNGKKLQNLSLYDITGRKIKQYNLIESASFTVDLSAFSSGLYLLQGLIDGHFTQYKLLK